MSVGRQRLIRSKKCKRLLHLPKNIGIKSRVPFDGETTRSLFTSPITQHLINKPTEIAPCFLFGACSSSARCLR